MSEPSTHPPRLLPHLLAHPLLDLPGSGMRPTDPTVGREAVQVMTPNPATSRGSGVVAPSD
jgi:hypothetical protein